MDRLGFPTLTNLVSKVILDAVKLMTSVTSITKQNKLQFELTGVP